MTPLSAPVQSPSPASFVDPSRPGYHQNPYPHLAEVREQAPIHVHPTSHAWMLLRYRDVARALRDPALSIQEKHDLESPRNQMVLASGGSEYLLRPAMSRMDRPEHTRLRRMMSPPFHFTAIEALRETAQGIVDDMLTPVGAGGTIEIVGGLGFQLPYRLISQMLGLPVSDDVSDISRWTYKTLNLGDYFLAEDQFLDHTEAGAKPQLERVRQLVEWKRDHLGDDIVSMLIGEGDRGEVISPEMVPFQVQLLLTAGFHTTVGQLALSLHALLTNPQQWDLLVRNPDLVPNAVEELLRFEPTAQFMVRTTPAPYRVDDVDIPAGVHIVAWIAAANRDPAQFGPTAAELDVTRAKAKTHIAFSAGPHRCLGAGLARLELETVIGTLVRRFPTTTIATEPRWGNYTWIRGMDELTLRLGV